MAFVYLISGIVDDVFYVLFVGDSTRGYIGWLILPDLYVEDSKRFMSALNFE